MSDSELKQENNDLSTRILLRRAINHDPTRHPHIIPYTYSRIACKYEACNDSRLAGDFGANLPFQVD